ncbi:MAG: YibE/F family protein [Spirochaetaceae bacterium]|nr:YibE/F family protein [Spirochaetaceae bacterium]
MVWINKDIIFSLVVLLLCVVLWFIPSGFEERQQDNTITARGRVLETDNANMEKHGFVVSGAQGLLVEIQSGEYKGQTFRTGNNFVGSMEFDHVFEPGDQCLVNISVSDGTVTRAFASDHYRVGIETVFVVLFCAFLLFYGGFYGFQAILSFVFTLLVLIKILVPAMLRGINPVLLSVAISWLLSAAILFLVAGINKKGLVAFIGSSLGLLVTAVLAFIFAGPFHVTGAVRPFAQALLNTGLSGVSLSSLLLAGVVLSASGAVMDLSMDISAALHELSASAKEIGAEPLSRKQLWKAGNNIGRSVIGTMTTTLLLAYSGSYLAFLMYCMRQGYSMVNVLNMNYMAAEILHTIAGSFGLVLVAPLTVATGALMYGRKAYS